MGKKNKLGVKGVHLTREGNYQARIKAHGKVKHLGTFPTLDKAARAYQQAALRRSDDFY